MQIMFKKSKDHSHQLMNNFPLMKTIKNKLGFECNFDQQNRHKWTLGQSKEATGCTYKGGN